MKVPPIVSHVDPTTHDLQVQKHWHFHRWGYRVLYLAVNYLRLIRVGNTTLKGIRVPIVVKGLKAKK